MLYLCQVLDCMPHAVSLHEAHHHQFLSSLMQLLVSISQHQLREHRVQQLFYFEAGSGSFFEASSLRRMQYIAQLAVWKKNPVLRKTSTTHVVVLHSFELVSLCHYICIERNTSLNSTRNWQLNLPRYRYPLFKLFSMRHTQTYAALTYSNL